MPPELHDAGRHFENSHDLLPSFRHAFLQHTFTPLHAIDFSRRRDAMPRRFFADAAAACAMLMPLFC
jgi:hypothetical protein